MTNLIFEGIATTSIAPCAQKACISAQSYILGSDRSTVCMMNFEYRAFPREVNLREKEMAREVSGWKDRRSTLLYQSRLAKTVFTRFFPEPHLFSCELFNCLKIIRGGFFPEGLIAIL